MREFFVNRPDTAAMERLLGSHASDAAGVAVRLAWQAGLLRDEITNLTWDQVDFERNQHLSNGNRPKSTPVASSDDSHYSNAGRLPAFRVQKMDISHREFHK